jgi:hypothetical protein
MDWAASISRRNAFRKLFYGKKRSKQKDYTSTIGRHSRWKAIQFFDEFTRKPRESSDSFSREFSSRSI